MAYEYHPDIPKFCSGQCPPADATPEGQLVYRGIKKLPLGDKDFLSAAEINSKGNDRSNCNHWGLSVWLTEEAAEHGRRLMAHMRKWHVAEGLVAAEEGVFLQTPTNSQNEHYTFWKRIDASIAGKFEIVMYPVPAGSP